MANEVPVGAVAVRGLAELSRDMKRMGADLSDDLRDELRRVAEPISGRAEELAVAHYGESAGGSEITHLKPGARWSKMRVGVSGKLIYVAPKEHGKKVGAQKRRPFGLFLLEQAMDPALEEWAPRIVPRVEKMLDNLADLHGL